MTQVAPGIDAIYEMARKLSEGDRLALAELLLDSLPAEPEERYDEAWDAEIRRRLDEIDNGQLNMIPGDEVVRRAYERLRASRI